MLALGDVIDGGDRAANGRNFSEAQYKLFLADYGFDGVGSLLKYRVYEGWGNHERQVVGAEGFEPSTFWSRTKRATRLRYTP